MLHGRGIVSQPLLLITSTRQELLTIQRCIQIMLFKKGDIIRDFITRNGKVVTTIKVNGVTIINPFLEQFKADGWEEYIPPTSPTPKPEPYIPTIEELVEQKIRERYTLNQEFEVNRKRDTNSQEFQVYYDYVEQCIAWAYEQPHREEVV